jgi:cellulose synthase/poly-beta-1,6-N-acetylglucosamine synthase-like glycosyltransferase
MRILAGRMGDNIARDTDYVPQVTLFIPAYNEERVIAQKLDNTLELDYPQDKLEVLVCSDKSDDRTNDIAAEYADRYSHIHLIAYEERSGKTGMINKAVPTAQGEIIVLSDANTMYAADSVRIIVSAFASSEIGAVLGYLRLYVQPGVTGLDKEVNYRDFEAALKKAEGMYGCAMGAFGGFYAIRKKYFTPLPANAYSNDDFLIPLRMIQQGLRVVFDPSARAEEETGDTLGEEFRRRIRIGAGNFQSFSLLPGMLNPLHPRRFFFYVSHKVLRWFSPFLLLGMLCTNAVLYDVFPFSIILYGQLLFYLFGGIGCILDRMGKSLPLISAVYHFISMNYAVFLGFFRFLRGIKSAVWTSTERQDA